MDQVNSGETSEDRFIGIIADRPIQSVRLHVLSRGFEVSEVFELDHLQFGSQALPTRANPCSPIRTILLVMADLLLPSS
jgi:hypothetical protein